MSLTKEEQKVLVRAQEIEVLNKFWGIRYELLRPLANMHGLVITQEVADELNAAFQSRMSRGSSGMQTTADGVAVIPLRGVLSPTPSLLALLFGGSSSLLGFRQDIRDAANDEDVSAIVMDVDSPGGMVDQIPEVASDIRNAAQVKPVVAVANTMAASAAYWLASQAHQVVVTPSGEVGSVGVYQVHVDESKALEAEGVTPTIISAGKFKAEANSFSPLSDDALAHIQQDVNDFYNMFTADVAKGRGVSQSAVKTGYGEGRSLLAKRAVSEGLADRVDTLENTVKSLGSPQKRASVMRQSAFNAGRFSADPIEQNKDDMMPNNPDNPDDEDVDDDQQEDLRQDEANADPSIGDEELPEGEDGEDLDDEEKDEAKASVSVSKVIGSLF